MFNQTDLTLANELLETICFFNQQGWSPATSTNYSVRSASTRNQYIISRSGVDKSKFKLEDLILIDTEARVLPPFNRPGIKSSAETEIHTFLYDWNPEINCVLHTHSILGTVLSMKYAQSKKIKFSGLEILKGLEGNSTHEMEEIVPVIPNSQSMPDIIRELKFYLDSSKTPQGFLIAGHGLYSWGKTISSAKRHIETYEFLFQCLQAMENY